MAKMKIKSKRQGQDTWGLVEDRADVWSRLYKQDIFPPMEVQMQIHFRKKHTNKKPWQYKTKSGELKREVWKRGGTETLDQTTNIVFDGRTNNVPSLWVFDYDSDDNDNVIMMFIWISFMMRQISS